MESHEIQRNEHQETVEYAESFLVVRNGSGIHVRPAGVIVKALQNDSNEVIFRYNSIEVNAKSVIGILMLGAPQGAHILVKIRGKDTQNTLLILQDVFEHKFGENC